VLAVVLFGGMFLGLFLSYREIESKRTEAAARAEILEPQDFYGWPTRDTAMSEELARRQIEHQRRRTALIADDRTLRTMVK
jgi:hypothetical protein